MADEQALQSCMSDELATLAARLRQSTVQVRGRRSAFGSGVIWRSDGVIVTNAHVLQGTGAIVELTDGRTFSATVTAKDPQRDLTVLTIDAKDLPAVDVGDATQLRTGELVFAVGNPFGLVGVLTTGIVHGVSKDSSQEWVQADIALAPGNSGGLLANAEGRVVGINSMIVNGLAYAIPSHAVTTFLQNRSDRPRLGVVLQAVAVPMTGSQIVGLLILEVAKESLAEKVGLLTGDILVGMGGEFFKSPHTLSRALNQAHSSKTLLLNFIRGGEFKVCDIVIGNHTSEVQAA